MRCKIEFKHTSEYVDMAHHLDLIAKKLEASDGSVVEEITENCKEFAKKYTGILRPKEFVLRTADWLVTTFAFSVIGIGLYCKTREMETPCPFLFLAIFCAISYWKNNKEKTEIIKAVQKRYDEIAKRVSFNTEAFLSGI